MAANGFAWIDKPLGRELRDRCVSAPIPQALPLLVAEERELLARWVRSDSESRRREALLKEAGRGGIERAEALCERLLREGWIVRRERLVGGSWQWEGIAWRDLHALKDLLGVGSARQRAAGRESALARTRDWLRTRSVDARDAALDPDLMDEMSRALEQFAAEPGLRLDLLAVRLDLLQAVAQWHDEGRQGQRRDFALHARGSTKGIGAADWRWLESAFDLERLQIATFAPTLWLAGEITLFWQARRVDLAGLHCLGIPMEDLGRADRMEAASGARPVRYWFIENRASFERQARTLIPGTVLVWLPGRPSTAWCAAMEHLLRLAPAPAAISADADPAGVDIACTVGRMWAAQGLDWLPHAMGPKEWQATKQRWALNDHDRALLQRLLASGELPSELRALCEAMQREGRKAEQEAWL